MQVQIARYLLLFGKVTIVFFIWVRLMCALRAHINKSIFGKVLLEIENVVKTFSISDKLFPKLVYYCVPLGHTLVKSYSNPTS